MKYEKSYDWFVTSKSYLVASHHLTYLMLSNSIANTKGTLIGKNLFDFVSKSSHLQNF